MTTSTPSGFSQQLKIIPSLFKMEAFFKYILLIWEFLYFDTFLRWMRDFLKGKWFNITSLIWLDLLMSSFWCQKITYCFFVSQYVGFDWNEREEQNLREIHWEREWKSVCVCVCWGVWLVSSIIAQVLICKKKAKSKKDIALEKASKYRSALPKSV